MGQINNCDRCGNCSKCGECCASLLPMTRKEEKTIKEYIKKNDIQPEFLQKGNDINLKCCFYDIENKKCKIYEVRPQICRTYKCNRNEETLLKERDSTQRKAYWNQMKPNDEIRHITDTRLLFYNDARGLIYSLVFTISKGTMKLDENGFEFIKKILRDADQKELADNLKGTFK